MIDVTLRDLETTKQKEKWNILWISNNLYKEKASKMVNSPTKKD